ncbi:MULTISPECIES: hypothetical protein [Burkholderia cepacia complex]|nr:MULTISPECIES: hypothetical protein [Burkholderia cepacia complex]MCA8002826.1 hypothetical protein [Burkholderia metallica]MCA8022685.1 hypothetical protein [Burkholderia metallica]
MLELIGWMQNGELAEKLTSPLFLFCAVAFVIAGYYCCGALAAARRQGEE